jgi:hypothetical protein
LVAEGQHLPNMLHLDADIACSTQARAISSLIRIFFFLPVPLDEREVGTEGSVAEGPDLLSVKCDSRP